MSLKELHLRTGLPKATLLRILLTLSQRGMVWQRMADGAYVAGVVEFGGLVPDINDRLAEIASPFMAELSNKVMWPSVIAVPRLDYMDVIETNGPIVRLDSAVLGPVGLKLSYIHTATGRAYLAACDPIERDSIIERIRPEKPDSADELLLQTLVAETQLRGYSARDPMHPWPDRSRQLVRGDGRRSIAVAVQTQGHPVASLNLTWPMNRTTLAEVVDLHLQTLQATAAIIGQRLSETLNN